MMASPQRVVITGMGIVSCLGNDLPTVRDALFSMQSGIRFEPQFVEMEFSSHIGAWPQFDLHALFDRKQRRFMGLTAAYAYAAALSAITHAQLPESILHHAATGLIAGSGAGSCIEQIDAFKILQSRGARRINPYIVPKWMASTVSANLATLLGIKGVSYSITAACATSAHCIGAAYQHIRHGLQDVVVCGGAEEIDPYNFMIFDAMGALSSHYNDAPTTASRPFDKTRDGFVMAAGGGMLVLESLPHALARGAPIIAEIIGYGATSDGADMVSPSGEGAVRCMHMALRGCSSPIDYVNAHGTSTPIGDNIELSAIKTALHEHTPVITSTKGLTGHAIGAAGVHEIIYGCLMMLNNFIAGNANLKEVDDANRSLQLPSHTQTHTINTFLSNSFGFGGTNASLLVQRFTE